ncbi:hypothetical protein HMF8227_02371 [Saliniradius amylolyticus]|uniref:HTH cro/C1-type domain-containing protein n=1 Tax=Saliniradius amylolyticus TaxID=2183582 RepID=A0A2S2E5B1_9ALTE|nr:helix-turn-helix domain-containing protein [Saliniradius amylolyticus]AWL12823.1 hypothetical protein HMF8227_02371 [Saliniradius amylolyticus]
MDKECLGQALASPKGPSYYVYRKLEQQQLTTNRAAKLIGVNQSTLSRFLNGGALTPEMAAKLNKALNMDIDTLFNLEAQCLADKARKLVSTP